MRLNIPLQSQITQLNVNSIPDADGILYGKSNNPNDLFFKDFNGNENNLTNISKWTVTNGLDYIAKIHSFQSSLLIDQDNSEYNFLFGTENIIKETSLDQTKNSDFNFLFGFGNVIKSSKYSSFLSTKESTVNLCENTFIFSSKNVRIQESNNCSIINSEDCFIGASNKTTLIGINESKSFSQDDTTFMQMMSLRPRNSKPNNPEIGTVVYYSGSTTEELQVYKSTGWATIA